MRGNGLKSKSQLIWGELCPPEVTEGLLTLATREIGMKIWQQKFYKVQN